MVAVVVVIVVVVSNTTISNDYLIHFSHLSSSRGWAVYGDCEEFLNDFPHGVPKVFTLGLSLMGLLRGLSRHLSLVAFL